MYPVAIRKKCLQFLHRSQILVGFNNVRHQGACGHSFHAKIIWEESIETGRPYEVYWCGTCSNGSK